MREIKFRAWVKKTKTMVDLYQTTPLALDANLQQDGIFIPFSEEFIIMQFSGLKDANDKEIYEGDILDFTVFDCLDNDKQYRGVVVYCGSRFMLWNKPNDEFYGGDGGFELDEVIGQGGSEVIGNIYENVKWSDSKVK